MQWFVKHPLEKKNHLTAVQSPDQSMSVPGPLCSSEVSEEKGRGSSGPRAMWGQRVAVREVNLEHDDQ